jgi:hypothetical protein
MKRFLIGLLALGSISAYADFLACNITQYVDGQKTEYRLEGNLAGSGSMILVDLSEKSIDNRYEFRAFANKNLDTGYSSIVVDVYDAVKNQNLRNVSNGKNLRFGVLDGKDSEQTTKSNGYIGTCAKP